MSKTIQSNQCLHRQFKASFNKKYAQQVSILLASSAFLLLGLPIITDLPGSKLLAQNVVSQNLDAAILYQLAVTRYQRQDLQGAEFAFRQALQRDPNIGMARNYLGNIFLEQNRLDLAVQEYGEAIRLNPNSGDAYYNLGLALQKQGQKEAAITAYRQALVASPTMAAAHYNLGLILYEQEQRQEAIAAFQQAINLDGNNSSAYFNLAIASQQEGQVEQAITAYRQALKLNPENTVAYNNLGSLMVIQGQPSQAITIYQQAIRQNPKNALAYYNLGVTLYNQGNLKEANQALKRARKEYGEQGNTEKAVKIDEMTQKITEYLIPKKPQISQTATPTPTSNSDVVLPAPEQAMPINSTDMPNTVEQRSR
ncbi:tetratricopeptide repeat protein [Anabaena sp. PCC 7108]|uniref:tetratricopeptide repeat protein n=1 Tax=Anabaena sp. PCC 7108 TaxID=163908 RepID=UPI00034789A5|nr:tetratricopeptide repeat protein [Anabaena sp. PCC 7108]